MYLQKQPAKCLYTKENLRFLAHNIKSSKDSFFDFFLENEDKINNVMNNNFFTTSVIDPIIIREEADSILGPEGSRTGILSAVIPVATIEPDWNKLYNKIAEKYNKEYAERDMLAAKIKWYGNYQWWPQWISANIKKINLFGSDTTDMMEEAVLADVAWMIFMKSKDPHQMRKAIEWMHKLCDRNTIPKVWRAWDTYANLLYKYGKIKQALKWEEKALKYAVENKDKMNSKIYKIILNDMKSGKPTWVTYANLNSTP
jgi:hypothetical protein